MSSTVGTGHDERRAARIQRWLVGRADTAAGRLASRWFRAYFASSRNSACATTIYAALSVLPMALAGVAWLHHSAADSNAFAERIVAHLRLHGASASLVHTTFGSASQNAAAATVAAVVGFLLWGIGIGQLYRDLYARAWGLEIKTTAADQVRFTVFFFVFTGAVGGLVLGASALRGAGWLVVLSVWFACSVVFWLWVPSYLLRRAVPMRDLLPGALLSVLVVGGTIAFAPLYLAPALNENGSAFGSFGVSLTVLGYLFIVVTMSMVCAVFAPVWRDWRHEQSSSPRPS